MPKSNRKYRAHPVDNLIAVHITLERPLNVQAQIFSLHLGKDAELGINMGQMQLGDLLIEDLGQDIDLLLELSRLGELDVLTLELLVAILVQHDLRQHLVREAARHDERRVARRAAQVDESAFGEKNDVAARRHEETVDLGLDVLYGLGVLLQPGNVDFNVEVADIWACCQLRSNNAKGEGCTYCRQWHRWASPRNACQPGYLGSQSS
jgi:hypothetical protein